MEGETMEDGDDGGRDDGGRDDGVGERWRRS